MAMHNFVVKLQDKVISRGEWESMGLIEVEQQIANEIIIEVDGESYPLRINLN